MKFRGLKIYSRRGHLFQNIFSLFFAIVKATSGVILLVFAMRSFASVFYIRLSGSGFAENDQLKVF